MASACPHHGMELFQARVQDADGSVQDVRKLYNDVFLPRMRVFLQHEERPVEEPKTKGGASKVTQLLLPFLFMSFHNTILHVEFLQGTGNYMHRSCQLQYNLLEFCCMQLSRLPLRSLSAKDMNKRPQSEKKRLDLMR